MFDEGVMKNIIYAAIMAIVGAAVVSSCHTIGGAGKDIQSVGSDISGAANAASNSL